MDPFCFKLLRTSLKNGLAANFYFYYLNLRLNRKPMEEKLRRTKTQIKLDKVVKDQLILLRLHIINIINAIKRATDDIDRRKNKQIILLILLSYCFFIMKVHIHSFNCCLIYCLNKPPDSNVLLYPCLILCVA